MVGWMLPVALLICPIFFLSTEPPLQFIGSMAISMFNVLTHNIKGLSRNCYWGFQHNQSAGITSLKYVDQEMWGRLIVTIVI
jgi:hypothetical protein